MDKDEKPAVKVLELVLHPQKRLVMALTRSVPAKQNMLLVFLWRGNFVNGEATCMFLLVGLCFIFIRWDSPPSLFDPSPNLLPQRPEHRRPRRVGVAPI